MVEALGVSLYDYAFLASGVLLMGIGVSLIRAGLRDAQANLAIPDARPILAGS